MITYRHDGEAMFMRLSYGNGGNVNARKAPFNEEAFYELEIDKDHARALLDESNWNYDADFEELVFQHGIIQFHMPKEEFEWDFNLNPRWVMNYKEWSWHLTIEDEIEELLDELKKLI